MSEMDVHEAAHMQQFTKEQLLAVAREHDVVPNGLNVEGIDVDEAWTGNCAGSDLLDQVNRAAALLLLAKRVKTKASGFGSYGLKHKLERASPGGYICNGAAIVACHLLGIKVWKHEEIGRRPENPNAIIGVSEKSDYTPHLNCNFTKFLQEEKATFRGPQKDFVRDWLSQAREFKRRHKYDDIKIAPVESLEDLQSRLLRDRACSDAIAAASRVWKAYEKHGSRTELVTVPDSVPAPSPG